MAESKGYSLGTGFIHATISFDGIGKQIADEMRKAQRPAEEGGKDTGEKFEGGFRKGLSGVSERIREAVTSKSGVAAAAAGGYVSGKAWTSGFNRAVSTSAISKSVGTAIAGLSGLRVVKDLGTSFKDFAKNLDRTTPKIGLISVALAGLSAAGIAGAGGLFGIINGLGSIAAVGLTLPGLLGAGAASMAVFTMAMMDAAQVLEGLGPMFQELQDSVSNAFWSRAADPIMNLANAVFPILLDRMDEVAYEMAGLAVAVSTVLGEAKNLAFLDQMFVYLRDSLDIAGEGVGSMTAALMELGLVGATYLPNLASSFNEMAWSFEAWVARSRENGDLFRWIDNGIVNLKALGTVLAATVGIFHKLGEAALEAGAGGLVGMAQGLDRINTALGTELWQGRLVSMFSAAGASMDAVGRGLSAFGDGLVNLGPTLNNVMVLSGLTFEALLKGFSEIMSHPAVGGGLQDMFEGFLRGVRNLAPAVEGIGPLVGGIMSTIGTLASTLGTVVASAVSAVGPVLASLMDAIRPMIPALGKVVTALIDGLAPVLKTVAGVIADVLLPPLGTFFGWLADNASVITGIATVIGVMAVVLGTAAIAVKAFTTALAILRGIMVAVNIVMAINPFVLVAAAIAGLVTAVILAYNRIGWFRDGVDAAWAWIKRVSIVVWDAVKAAIAATVDWLVNTAWPAITNAVSWIGDKFVWLGDKAQDAWGWIKGAISNVVDWFTGTVVPVMREANNRIGGFFDFLHRNFIAPVMLGIQIVIRNVSEWFSRTVVASFRKAIDAIGAKFRWLYENLIRPVWTWIQDKINTVVRWFANTLVPWLRERVQSVMNKFTDFRNALGKVWDWVKARIDSVVRWFAQVLVPWFRERIQSVINKFTDFRTSVNNVWERVKTLLRDGWNWVDRNVFSKFKSGLDTLVKAFNDVKDGIGKAWDKLKAKVKEPISFVVNKVLNPFLSAYNSLNDAWSGTDIGEDPKKPIKGFHTGGYTGPGAKYKPAGVVHADEYVIRKESQNDLRKNAPGLLDRLNQHGSKALGYHTGGLVNGKIPDGAQLAGPGTRVYGVPSFNWAPQQAMADFGEVIFRRVGALNAGWRAAQSAAAWDGVSGLDVKWQNGGSGESGAPVVKVSQFGIPGNVAGFYASNTNSIALDSSQPLSGNLGKTITVHEMGHAVGLPHAHVGEGGSGVHSIMNYDTMFNAGAMPTTADIKAMQAIYPGGTGKGNKAGSADADDGNVWLDQLKNIVTKPIDMAKDMFKGNKFAQMPLGIADKLVEGVIDKAAGLIGLGGDDKGPAGSEQVTKWMTTALKKKDLFSEANLASGVRRAMQESGGDPRAVNDWDSNAQMGDPSKGLMQTIGATFRQYMEPGHSDVFNAVDNILASINYTLARYGSLRAGWDRPGGYADGGLVKAPKMYPGNTWDDPVGTVHKLSPGVSSIYNGTGGDEFFERVTPNTSNGAPLVENLYALDVDEAMRKLEYTRQKRERLAYAG